MHLHTRLNDIKLQLLLIIVSVAVVYKMIIGTTTSFWLGFIHEMLIFTALYLILLNGKPAIKKIVQKPIALLKGIGMSGLALLVFFEVIPVIFSAIGMTAGSLKNSVFLYTIINAVYHLAICMAAMFIFLGLGELLYLKQKRKVTTYYNAMILFFFLASLTAILAEHSDYVFIHYAFLVNAIILIVINSGRISWIAFLSKKEKRTILYLSVGLIVLFAFILGSLASESDHATMMKDFSPGVTFFVRLSSIYAVIYSAFLFFTALFHLPTAEAFDRRSKEISSLQYVSRLLNQVLDFKELASTVTDLATTVCSADAAWIVLLDESDNTPIAPKNIGFMSATGLYKIIKDKLPGNKDAVLLVDLKQVRNTGDFSEEKYTFAAVAPLKAHNKTNGYLITTKKAEMPFDDDDRNTLESFADYAAIALENSRLFSQSIEKERLEKELDVAREMQLKLIPETPPVYPNTHIAASFIPAFEVGGDYYDFFDLPDGKLGFIIADVSGKGISAAFIMAEIRGIFESVTRLIAEPKAALVQVNAILQRTLQRKHFITAIYGTLNPLTGEVSLCRAGHTPALLLSDGVVTEQLPQGMGLGLHYSRKFEDTLEEQKFTLKSGDVLVFFTDGVTEAKNEKLDDFGMEQLKSVVSTTINVSPAGLQEQIIKAVSTFSQGSAQHDDISMLIIQWNLKTLETIHG